MKKSEMRFSQTLDLPFLWIRPEILTGLLQVKDPSCGRDKGVRLHVGGWWAYHISRSTCIFFQSLGAYLTAKSPIFIYFFTVIDQDTQRIKKVH